MNSEHPFEAHNPSGFVAQDASQASEPIRMVAIWVTGTPSQQSIGAR
jgi:hypothetical protein